jgi:hypothetical protein
MIFKLTSDLIVTSPFLRDEIVEKENIVSVCLSIKLNHNQISIVSYRDYSLDDITPIREPINYINLQDIKSEFENKTEEELPKLLEEESFDELEDEINILNLPETIINPQRVKIFGIF